MLCLNYSQASPQRQRGKNSPPPTLKKEEVFLIFKVSPWERVFVCERLIMLQKETPPPFSPTLLPTWHPGVFLVLPLGEG